MKNHWVCQRKRPFAEWLVTFLKTQNHKDVQNLIDYMEKILLLGREQEVLIAEGISLSDHEAPDGTYIEQARWLVENKSVLPFFRNFLEANYQGKVSGKIAFFDKQDAIQMDTVSDIANLLRHLRPRGVVKWGQMETMRTAPLTLDSTYISVLNDEGKGMVDSEPSFSFMLFTDIWFPFVMGGMDMDWELWGDGIYTPFPNLGLAQNHTPRLNVFLEKARQLTLDLGGAWYLMEDLAPEFYEPMLTETGIRLDITEEELTKAINNSKLC